MGSIASKAAGATSSGAANAAVRAAGPTSSRVGGAAANGTGSVASTVQGGRSAKSEEWARLLREMSNKIETREWDGRELDKVGPAEDATHPAARAAAVRSKLPKSRKRDADASGREPGMLAQAQVVGLYKLVRRDPVKWNAETLSSKFNVAESDLKALLHYTRTYTAHLGIDGSVRGLYDIGADPMIARFEDLKQ